MTPPQKNGKALNLFLSIKHLFQGENFLLQNISFFFNTILKMYVDDMFVEVEVFCQLLFLLSC